jgi:ribosomal protein S18 acetylase RimI-like enzyme
MLIRAAAKTDISRIAELQRQLSKEESIYGFAAETAEQIAASEYLLVAETGGEIIGFIAGKICVSEGLAVIPAGAKYIEIENLYVAPPHRKQGAGGRLVDELLALGRRETAAYALLYSAARDIHGILKFYERHEFQSWSVQMFQKL